MKPIYFISDIHLGYPDFEKSLIREKLLVSWLEEIEHQAGEIYLVGDIFDVWFEFKRVVPRGFTRFLGTLARISDRGIPVHFFPGNHDHWIRNYLEQEIGIKIHIKPLVKEINGSRFFIAHGDGLGPGDNGYKFMKKVFTNPVLKWLYTRLHPNFGIGLAKRISLKSRNAHNKDEINLSRNDERLVTFARETLRESHYDYLIFGHRHVPRTIDLGGNSTFVNLGDWINNFSYAVCDEQGVRLETFKNKKREPIN